MRATSAGRTVLRASHYRTGATEEFIFESGRLVARTKIRAKVGLVFGPGFLDLQCNGYAGVDYNHPGTTPEQIAESIQAMWRSGCTLVLPTVITGAPERMEAFFRKLLAALSLPEIRQSIPGFHLEGPFISPEDGARGAHPLAAVRPPDRKLWARLQRAAGDSIRLLTIAPEVTGALKFIAALRQENVLSAIGHTMADSETVQRAADAGALMSTHLGNGCPQMMHRHANPVFAQLGEDRLAASVIADGIHLPAEVLRTIALVKGTERTVLVTDAMAAADAPPGRYTLGEHDLEVGADRVVRQPGSPNFAGSALSMDRAVGKFAAMTNVSLADAWDAASVIPARLLRTSGAVKTRMDAGTVIARVRDGIPQVVATVRGRRVLWLDQRE
ncbi:N-acetylglucosamine-6-phosphate deacetylase [Verrucomicrobiota bacterium sgz303538]